MNGLPSGRRIIPPDILPVVVKCGIRTVFPRVHVSRLLLRAECFEVCRFHPFLTSKSWLEEDLSHLYNSRSGETLLSMLILPSARFARRFTYARSISNGYTIYTISKKTQKYFASSSRHQTDLHHPKLSRKIMGGLTLN